MRGLAVVVAASAAWLLVGAPVPKVAYRYQPPTIRVAIAAVSAGLMTALLSLSLTSVGSVAAAAGLIAAGLPLGADAYQSRRLRQATIETWPDFLTRLRGYLGAGQSLSEAFANAGEVTGGRLGELCMEVSRRTAQGVPFGEALETMRETLADPTTDRVITMLTIANRSGGSRVARVIGTVGQSVADEVRLRKAHDSALTQQRVTAGVALLAPWVLLVLTVSTNSAAADAYRTSTGQFIVGAGLASTAVGYLAARSAAHLSEPRRVFQ